MCIIVACLPPLRRTFDNILKRILPHRVLEKIGALSSHPSYDLPTIYTTKMTLDGESSRDILSNEEYIEDENGRIVRAPSPTLSSEVQNSPNSGRVRSDNSETR